MPSLILPETTPPQVAPEAADKIIDHIFCDGLISVYDASLLHFKQQHPALREYLLGFSFEQDGRPVDNTFTYAALRIGAVVSSFAYYKSGYDVVVDDEVLAMGVLSAEQEGVPDAFITRTIADPELQRILSILPETPLMQEDVANGEYGPILDIGAGATRFYMQQALVA